MKKRSLLKSLSMLLTSAVVCSISVGCTGQPTKPVDPIGQVVTPENNTAKVEEGKTQVPPAEQSGNSPSQIVKTPSDGGTTNTSPNKTVPNTDTKPSTPQPAPTKPAPSVSSPSTTASEISYWAEVEDYILKMVNDERGKNGRSPLSLNSTMRGFARDKSKEMIDLNYFDHNSPRNGYISDILNKNGIKYKNVGENIAMQQSSETISSSDMAKKFMDMWMNSSGHRANILSPDYATLGVGVAKKSGLVEATQEFFTPM